MSNYADAVKDYVFSVVWNSESGCFKAWSPEFTESTAQGDTDFEALDRAKDSVAATLKDLKRKGQSAPEPISRRFPLCEEDQNNLG